MAVLMVCSVMFAFAANASAAENTLPASEQLFLLTIGYCPDCLTKFETPLLDEDLNVTEDLNLECSKCDFVFNKDYAINCISSLAKESNPEITDENLSITVSTLIGICPDCNKTLESKEHTTSENGMTTTMDVGYCTSCGFDEINHPEVLEAKSNMMFSLMSQMLSYSFKYQHLMTEEDIGGTEKPEDTKPENTKPEDTKPEDTNKPEDTVKPEDDKTESDKRPTLPEVNVPGNNVDADDKTDLPDTDDGDVLIPDDSDVVITPNGKNPETGVEKHAIAAIALIAASVAAVVILKKKKDK